jgi:hypothetical protein
MRARKVSPHRSEQPDQPPLGVTVAVNVALGGPDRPMANQLLDITQ